MQTDLFEIPVNASSVQPTQKFNVLERYRFTLRLDQALIGAIALIVAYVFIFSFGVEKGKRFAMEELKAERAKRESMVHELREKLVAQPIPSSNAVPTPTRFEKTAISESQTVTLVTKQTKGYPSGKYTIQIVTYKSQSLAERAIEGFSKKGLQGFTIPAGPHWQVCINAFESHKAAAQTLRQLKAQRMIPPDAYIRLIPQ